MTSRLFQPLTSAQLTAVVAQHFPHTQGFQSRLATGGLFNTSYTLTLADGRRYMLTVGPVNRQLLIPYERQLMPAAAAAYAMLRQAALPCPEVVARADEQSLLNRSYMLTKYIPGKPLNSPAVPPEAKATLYRQFGTYMKRMHAITAPRWGRLSDTAAGRGRQRLEHVCAADHANGSETARRPRTAGAIRRATAVSEF